MTTENQITTGVAEATEEPLNIAKIEQEDGSVEIEFLEDPTLADLLDGDIGHYENLALYIDLDELATIAADVIDVYEEDESSRAGHMEDLANGIDQLGLDDTNVETPFDGACTVFHPLIMENAVKFQAKAEGELLPAKGPVKAQILGLSNEALEAQAYRVKRHMNWQTTDQMTEFYPNSEKALLQVSLFGDCFKKNYYDHTKGRVCDSLVPIDRLVVNNSCESLENAECLTELQYISEREMLARQYSGLYDEDADIGEPYRLEKSDISNRIDEILGMADKGEGYEVIEQHAYLDLTGFEDESGVPLPYIITVETASKSVLAIRRNWKEGGNKFNKREWFSHYYFVPGFGFYNLGYIHLLGNFQNTLTAILRGLVDAGSFSNMQGGFKSKALRVLDDGSAISPGEFRDVEFYGQDLSKGIYPFAFKEPSNTLFALLQFMEGRGQKFADSTEQVVADATNYGPVGTTMALLESSAKFFATVFKRLHMAQKKQLRIIAELNYENLPEDDTAISFNVPGEEINISRADYDDRVDIVPVSDPNIPSSSHRLTMASQKLQSALQSPQIHNLHEVYKQYYIAMGDEHYESYLPSPEEAQRLEPLEDISAASQGKPIKAFPDQDHEAHIAVKTAFLNDPSVMGNPALMQIGPVLQANIQEHTIQRFGEQLQGGQSMGLNAAQAAQEIATFNQHKAANPMGQLDPKQIIAKAAQMEQENEAKKIALKEQELQLDKAVESAEIDLKVRDQEIEVESLQLKLAADKEKERIRIASDMIKESLKGKLIPKT
jgi:hypothetical protein